MNSERRLWIAIGLMISGFTTIALGAMALGGFADRSSGDLAVSSTPISSDLLIALGAAVLLGLEFAHTRRQRPSRALQPAPAQEAVEA